MKKLLILLMLAAVPVALPVGGAEKKAAEATEASEAAGMTAEAAEATGEEAKVAGDNSDKLVVVWTSGDPAMAHSMVLMYAHNAKRVSWFDEVTLIIWGPSAKLSAEDEKIQAKLAEMIGDGVVIEACVACADMYGVADRLKDLGYDVKPMGKPLTDYLKAGYKVLTF